MQDCKFYKSKVNIQNGTFETKRMPVNPGTKSKNTGYRLINLPLKASPGHITEYVHRAIFQEATGFMIPPGFQIHHRDGDKDHNSIHNLCLCTAKFNNREAAKTRDYKQIYESRKKNGFKQKVTATSGDFKQTFPSLSQCGKELGICVSRISSILRNTLPYHKAYSKTTKKKYTFVRA